MLHQLKVALNQVAKFQSKQNFQFSQIQKYFCRVTEIKWLKLNHSTNRYRIISATPTQKLSEIGSRASNLMKDLRKHLIWVKYFEL